MNRKILIPLWLIVALVACGGVRPVTTLQVIHSSLATAQDIEASLCWGAANVRLVPADQDRTHCTSPTASRSHFSTSAARVARRPPSGEQAAAIRAASFGV